MSCFSLNKTWVALVTAVSTSGEKQLPLLISLHAKVTQAVARLCSETHLVKWALLHLAVFSGRAKHRALG